MKIVHFKFLSSVAQFYGEYSQTKKRYFYFSVNACVGQS